MKSSKNSLVLAAAFAGLLTGTTARVSAAPSGGNGPAIDIAGHVSDSAAKKAEKHAC